MQVLRGKIVPGFGVGGEIIQDYLQIFKREIKMDIFPGTLNLELDKEWEMPENCGFIEGFVKSDGTKRGSVYFIRAKIKNLPVFIIRPELTKHPKNIIELISAINIMKQYGLKNGDVIEVWL